MEYIPIEFAIFNLMSTKQAAEYFVSEYEMKLISKFINK